jgi:hypothetical protein
MNTVKPYKPPNVIHSNWIFAVQRTILARVSLNRKKIDSCRHISPDAAQRSCRQTRTGAAQSLLYKHVQVRHKSTHTGTAHAGSSRQIRPGTAQKRVCRQRLA